METPTQYIDRLLDGRTTLTGDEYDHLVEGIYDGFSYTDADAAPYIKELDRRMGI